MKVVIIPTFLYFSLIEGMKMLLLHLIFLTRTSHGHQNMEKGELSQCLSNVMLHQNVLSHFVALWPQCNKMWQQFLQKESEWWPVVTAASHLLQSTLSSLWNWEIQGWEVEVDQQRSNIWLSRMWFRLQPKEHKVATTKTWREIYHVTNHYQMDNKARVGYWSWPA